MIKIILKYSISIDHINVALVKIIIYFIKIVIIKLYIY